MIKILNISKTLDNVKLLDDVSFEVSQELVAILGATGEGKTVLLKIVAGLIKPDSGKAVMDKGETSGFVFQHSSLFDSLTVEKNIRIPLEERSDLKEVEINNKVLAVVNLLNLDKNLLKKRPVEISGGERKIVAICRAIINEPTYLFYDEPTTGLDPLTHDRICLIIKNLNKPGILVTHNLDTIKSVGVSRIYLLKSGKLNLMSLSKGEIITKERYE